MNFIYLKSVINRKVSALKSATFHIQDRYLQAKKTNIMKNIIFLFVLISLNTNAQCTWNSFFPFQAGNSKFDIARIKSTNPTVADTEDKEGLNDIIDLSNNGLHKFEYLKDSVYLNFINLRFINNNCFKGYSNNIQVTLSDDKLHKGKVKLRYYNYDTMKKQYDELLKLVPDVYRFTLPFQITNKKTNEKVGEGLWFMTKENSEQDEKLNRLGISYEFNFKRVKDKGKYHSTNEIVSYTIEIDIVDLRQSRLTRQGY